MKITDRDLGAVEMVVHILLYPLNWRLCRPQSQSGRYEEENSLVCKCTFGISLFQSL